MILCIISILVPPTRKPTNKPKQQTTNIQIMCSNWITILKQMECRCEKCNEEEKNQRCSAVAGTGTGNRNRKQETGTGRKRKQMCKCRWTTRKLYFSVLRIPSPYHAASCSHTTNDSTTAIINDDAEHIATLDLTCNLCLLLLLLLMLNI